MCCQMRNLNHFLAYKQDNIDVEVVDGVDICNEDKRNVSATLFWVVLSYSY